jgi:predicted molibdopterin-dependent oxidoreductase YjgC
VTDETVRKKFEEAWDTTLSLAPGLAMTEIFDAARNKEIKALYLIGENPLLSDPDAGKIRDSLEALDFFVVQDMYLSETAQLADVVLPSASFAGVEGTFTNTERKIQRIRKAIDPVGDSKADWWIICQIARKMGAGGFEFENASKIMSEITSLVPSYGGISYSRIEDAGLQWPCPSMGSKGTPSLHAGQFIRGKGKFMPLEYKPPAELPDSDYPLILITGRSPFNFHTIALIGKVGGLNMLIGREPVEINPEDALSLGIADGDMVKVISRLGEAAAEVMVNDSLASGTVFMKYRFAESPVKMLTNPDLDSAAKIPKFIISAVRIEKAASK